MQKGIKRKQELSEDVKKAVDDLLNGTSVTSSGEWLQREYIRLLRREAQYRKFENESKLKQDTDKTNGEHSDKDRSN